ncbi:MAG: right-handed parallel beta-helix repeat-containing protein, partial [Elusimicrobia bacterium]|nr:right-handed parallel beta-helix repeat-containing protein [Elusimicrobiota bacterium]
MALAAASLALPVPVRAITCSTTKIVKQAGGGDCTTIQSCVNGIPTPLVGDYCIDVQDNATYAEQVTVRNIANAGYQIVIGSSTANFRPALNPPGASAAAFLIANASVTIFNLDVKPANVITYGVQISSAYVTISSVNIQDAGGKINTAGIYVSSWNTVSYTSVTVNAAHGFWLPGSTMTAISYSSAVNNSTTQHAFYLNGASSNTFTAVLASNTAAGRAMSLDKSANYNTISLSTMSGPGASGGVYLNTASSNTFTGSYFDGRQNRALYFDSGATYNTVSRSTTTFNTGGSTYGIWFNDNNVSYNTITQSWLFSDSRNVLFNSGAHHNTISLSTVSNSGGSGSDSAVFFSGTNTSSNTVTQSYLWGATGTGVKFDSGASYNTVSQSTVANNSSFSPDYTVLFQGGSGSQRAKYNTVSGSFIASYNASGKGVLFNGTGNTLTLSTVTALAAGLGAVYASNTSSSTISQSYIYNSAGYGLWLDAGSSYTAVSQSTVAGGAAGQAALYVSGSSGNVLTQSLIWNLSGPAALFTGVGASLNTVSFSTMNGTNSYGLFLDKTSSNTIWNSHVQGSTAAIVSGSTGATINASVLVGTNTSGSGVWVSSGVNLFISSNTITGGTNGAGAYLDINNRGLLTLSTNTINAGPQYGLYVATQAAGTALWVTSNTIVPTVTSARNTYGIYLNGLTSGATIQNNAVVYRTSGSMGVNSTWALYAQSVSGLNVDHNRFSNPGTITGGVYNGVAFSGAANTAFKFNDVNSTGTGLTNAYLLQLSVSSVTIKNNVFLASMTVTGSSASLTADAASGFNGANGSNYNDWYSSNTANTFIWGGQAYAFSNGWTGQDANSIASNPLWFNPVGGVEDFHPKSVQGRYNPATQAFVPDGATSATVDAGDPTEAYALEPSPNGSRANMGSYGNTAQASESNVAGCSTQLTVSQANGPYTTIQGAVNAIPASLTGYTCVVIQDGATYAEQVTVQGFTNNGSSITIRADPATGLTPAVNPPANSTAAFHILQGSVNVIGINIAPSNAVTYGIQASSNWVTISSVNVQDAGGKISLAGIALSSSSAVLSYSSVTVTTAHGLRVAGNWNTVFESSAQANSASLYALYLQAASSNTFTVFFASNSAGWVVDLDGSSTQNSLSSMTAFGLSGVGGTANTVAKSYLYGTNIALDFSGTLNTISLSTITGNINSYAAYGNVGSSVALTQDYIYNAGTGYGLYLNTNIGYTTISQSTITSGGGPAVFLGHNGGTFGHTTISGSFISGLGGQGIAVNGSSPYNTIRQSTITGTNHALGIVSSSTTIVDCYLQASTAVYISGSTGTVIGGSVLVGTNTTGSGVWLAGGSVNLTLTSNTITGGTNGSGVLLDANNSG